jgi:UDP-glucose 4-epimerase
MINLKNSKILVTGGAGFVGSNIVEDLISNGASVTVLDNLYTGFEEFVPNSENVTFVKGDVEDRDLVNDLVRENKLIIHAAAKNIIASTKDPYADYESNIGGTLNILMSAKKHGIEKLVFAGSSSIYGNPTLIPIPESTAPYTLSPYAVSKLAGENYCIAFYENYGIPISIVRYSNVYGKNQDPRNPYCGVISKFFNSAINGDPILIHGDGEQTRDFTFVKDASSATIQALCNEKSVGNIFNIGTGFEISINNIAKKIVEITDSTSSIEHVDKRDIDNIRRRSVSIEHIRRALRWVPNYAIDDGLKNTYEWIKSKLP